MKFEHSEKVEHLMSNVAALPGGYWDALQPYVRLFLFVLCRISLYYLLDIYSTNGNLDIFGGYSFNKLYSYS